MDGPISDPAALQRALAETTSQLHELQRAHAGLLDAARDSNADDEHDPEGSTLAWERQQLATLIARGQRTLAELEAALARSAAGTYGTCELCGLPIAPGRLAARPAATTCITCATARGASPTR